MYYKKEHVLGEFDLVEELRKDWSSKIMTSLRSEGWAGVNQVKLMGLAGSKTSVSSQVLWCEGHGILQTLKEDPRG